MSKHYFTRQVQLDHARQTGWTVITSRKAPVILAFKDIAGKVHVKGWTGKRDKEAFYHAFGPTKTLTAMQSAEEFASQFVAGQVKVAEYKAGRKAERAAANASLQASDHYMVGDVLYHTWGYDQTNVDWVQVVEVKAKSIVVRPIKSIYAETNGYMSGVEQPCRNEFSGQPATKRVDGQGYCGFSKWTGRAVTSTHYA